MYCIKCGVYLEDDRTLCDNCLKSIEHNNIQNQYAQNGYEQNQYAQNGYEQNQYAQNGYEQNQYVQNASVQHNRKIGKLNNYIYAVIGAVIGLVCLFFIATFYIVKEGIYYFSDSSYGETQIYERQDTGTGKYKTCIITDNTYTGMSISSKNDALELIKKDSVSQKSTTSKEILEIENELIDKYGIYAANLCEMDVNHAKEVASVLEKVYTYFPSIRGELTNLSLNNVSGRDSYIAAFLSGFKFASSDSESTYPWVYKVQILLNTKYFLNMQRLEAAVKDSSDTGHFPKNATVYSPVAHEFGHYISFIATLKKYQVESTVLVQTENMYNVYNALNDFNEGTYSLEIITTAYNNCKAQTGTKLGFDEWRATISEYAVTKDNNGNYIYDETIAEGFHDVYLNGENAVEASRYIVEELKRRVDR